jgi:single-strand DNA-binding protein
MANLNKVMLIGNLTRDPEIKYTPKGQAIAELGLAINRRYTTESGEKREETTFVDVTLWGRLAEIAKEYLVKGRPVYIEGRLTLDTWDDKQTGQKRSKMRVTGDQMQLLGSRGDGGGGGGGGFSGGGGGGGGGAAEDFDQRPAARGASGGGGQQARRPPAPAAPAPDEEDDIPF